MIAMLTGIIHAIGTTDVILTVQGVGYLVHCSQTTLKSLPHPGQVTTLIIETVVREESITLYGFFSPQEKECFLVLTSVQGVGMRIGIALLSIGSPSEIIQAVASGNKEKLTQAEGVGPKLATRIINELKDKIQKLDINISISSNEEVLADNNQHDTLSALLSLGYKRNDIIATLKQIDNPSGSTQELIRACLAQLTRQRT